MNSMRVLAWQSLLFAAGTAFAALISPIPLPRAAPLGQATVVALGAALAVSTFAFGLMLTFRSKYARKMGFFVVAVAFLSSALFGLLSFVVDESRFVFLLGALSRLHTQLLRRTNSFDGHMRTPGKGRNRSWRSSSPIVGTTPMTLLADSTIISGRTSSRTTYSSTLSDKWEDRIFGNLFERHSRNRKYCLPSLA